MRLFFFVWSTHVFAAFNLTWGTPALSLDTNPPLGDTDSNAYIAMDNEGNAVATWSRTNGKGAIENIWAASHNHSLKTWTGAIKISGSGSASHSKAAVDREGNAIFVWEEGFPTSIRYRMVNKNGVWSPDLSTLAPPICPSKNAQTNGHIVIDGAGNILATWLEFFGGKNHLMSAFKPNGSSWVNLGMISRGVDDVIVTNPKTVVMNEKGAGAVIWQEEQNGLFLSRFDQGVWLPAIQIAPNGATSPTIAIDEEADLVIAWTENQIIYSQIVEKGKILPFKIQVSNSNYPADHPFIGVDGFGNATIVFEREDSYHKFIAGANLPKGAHAWTEQIDISGPTPKEQIAAGYPVFAMNQTGDGVAIWKEWTGENMVIQGAGYSLHSWSSIKTLSSSTGQAGSETPAYDISVALNLAGHVLAIWPEDPQLTGTQQIKATAGMGLANRGPKPPKINPTTLMNGVATGRQILIKFPAHADLVNLLEWSCVEYVDHFNIYRTNLATLIGTTKELRYEDHQREPKKKVTYLITSVDRFGHESGPITLIVDPI